MLRRSQGAVAPDSLPATPLPPAPLPAVTDKHWPGQVPPSPARAVCSATGSSGRPARQRVNYASAMARSPSDDEAAAIAAAVERFVAETAPASGVREEAIGPWQRAALLEGVSAKGTVTESRGGERWLS